MKHRKCKVCLPFWVILSLTGCRSNCFTFLTGGYAFHSFERRVNIRYSVPILNFCEWVKSDNQFILLDYRNPQAYVYQFEGKINLNWSRRLLTNAWWHVIWPMRSTPQMIQTRLYTTNQSYLFRSLVLGHYLRSRSCSEDSHNILLSAPLAPIMKFPTMLKRSLSAPCEQRRPDQIQIFAFPVSVVV